MKIQCLIIEGKPGKTAYRGEILEDGVLVGSFHQRSPKTGAWPLTYKFRTDGAKARFEALADSLTIGEIIEAMVLH